MTVYYDDDAYDDARADAAAEAREEAAMERLSDYHHDAGDDCPAEHAGDDDCVCADAMAGDYRLDAIER